MLLIYDRGSKNKKSQGVIKKQLKWTEPPRAPTIGLVHCEHAVPEASGHLGSAVRKFPAASNPPTSGEYCKMSN